MKRADAGRTKHPTGDGYGYDRVPTDNASEMSDEEFWGRVNASSRLRASTTRNKPPTEGVRSGKINIPKR